MHESDQLQDYLINNQLMVDPKLVNFNVLLSLLQLIRSHLYCFERTKRVSRIQLWDLNPWAYWLQSWDFAPKALSHCTHSSLSLTIVGWDRGTCSTSPPTKQHGLNYIHHFLGTVQWTYLYTQGQAQNAPKLCSSCQMWKWMGGTTHLGQECNLQFFAITLIQNWLQLWQTQR